LALVIAHARLSIVVCRLQVLLMHPEKKTVLENYQYTDIVTWGHSDEKFIVVVSQNFLWNVLSEFSKRSCEFRRSATSSSSASSSSRRRT
jgi:hypothetical protein